MMSSTVNWIKNESAWRCLVAILTLDRTKPFFPDLGLGTVSPSIAQRILRQWLHRYLTNEILGDPKPKVCELIQTLSGEFGEVEAERFGRRAQYGYFLAHDAPLNQWRRHMIRWCRRPELWQQLGLPIETSEAIRLECLKVTSDEALEATANAIREQPLSDWDLGIYAVFGFDDDENDPLNSVTLTIDRIKFLRFWRELDRTLNEHQKQVLLENARRIVAAEGSRLQLDPIPTQR